MQDWPAFVAWQDSGISRTETAHFCRFGVPKTVVAFF